MNISRPCIAGKSIDPTFSMEKKALSQWPSWLDWKAHSSLSSPFSIVAPKKGPFFKRESAFVVALVLRIKKNEKEDFIYIFFSHGRRIFQIHAASLKIVALRFHFHDEALKGAISRQRTKRNTIIGDQVGVGRYRVFFNNCVFSRASSSVIKVAGCAKFRFWPTAMPICVSMEYLHHELIIMLSDCLPYSHSPTRLKPF